MLGRRLRPGETAPGDFTYSVIDADLPAGGGWSGRERRVDKRIRTRLRDAIVSERKFRALVDCRIANRSKDGARLRLLQSRALPKSFILTDGASRCLFRAVLVWQVGADAGVTLAAID